MPCFGEWVDLKFRQILPSFPEGGLRALVPLTPREAVWAMVGAVMPPLEDPFRQVVVEREVLGIARRVRTLRGGVALAGVLGVVVSSSLMAGPAMPAPPAGGGMLTWDSGLAWQKFKDTMTEWLADFQRDSDNHYRHVHNAVVAMKKYKQVRQMYNRVATGTIDIALIPNIPTVEYELPISGDGSIDDGSIASDGIRSGAFMRGRMQFMTMSPRQRQELYGKLPAFRPRINLVSKMKSLLSGVDFDADFHSVHYDQDGNQIKVKPVDSIRADALADSTAAWLFSFHEVGIGDVLSAPEKIRAFNDDLNRDRLSDELEAERNLYKAVMAQKQIDDAIRAKYPSAGPSYTYKVMLEAYKAKQEQRRLLGDPNSSIARHIRELNREIARVEGEIQAAAYMRTGSGIASNVIANSKERDRDAAQMDSKEPAKDSTVTVKDALLGAATAAGAEKTPDQAGMALDIKALNRLGSLQDLLKTAIDVVAGSEVKRLDEIRLEEAKRMGQIAGAIEAQGGLTVESSKNLLALQKLHVMGPSFVLWPDQRLVVYGYDENGQAIEVEFPKPPDPPVVVQIDPNGLGMKKVKELRDQKTLNYMTEEAKQTAEDLKSSLKTASGVFGKDFVSRMYYQVASGFKAVFGLKNFDLKQDAKAMENSGKPLVAFYRQYNKTSPGR